MSKMTKILQISDTHIVPEHQLAYGQVDTAAALEETVKTVNRMLAAIGPVDAVIVTGDLTDFGTMEDYERFHSLMAPLKLPYLALPGNHDNREVMRSFYANSEWMPASGPLQWQLDLDDFAVIGLDSHVEGNSHGDIAEDGLAFLKEALDKAAGKPVIVAFHHPPFHTGLHPMDKQNLRDSDRLATLLGAYKGELRIICGHVHRGITTSFAGHICMTAPGTSHAVTIDLREEANNSLTKEPGGFVLHEWRAGRFVSHTIPVGTFDGPHPFF